MRESLLLIAGIGGAGFVTLDKDGRNVCFKRH